MFYPQNFRSKKSSNLDSTTTNNNNNHTNYNFLKCDWCINCCILGELICKVAIGQLAEIEHL